MYLCVWVETVTQCVCRGQTTACSYGSWGLTSGSQVCQQVLLLLSQLTGRYCGHFASGLMVPSWVYGEGWEQHPFCWHFICYLTGYILFYLSWTSRCQLCVCLLIILISLGEDEGILNWLCSWTPPTFSWGLHCAWHSFFTKTAAAGTDFWKWGFLCPWLPYYLMQTMKITHQRAACGKLTLHPDWWCRWEVCLLLLSYALTFWDFAC